MISRLIESKPEELRVFIEEAAGISKYKERRRETESRMRRTLENLERLTDLRDELGRQLQHLQRQAAGGGKVQGRSRRRGADAAAASGGGAVARPAGTQSPRLRTRSASTRCGSSRCTRAAGRGHALEELRVTHSERSDALARCRRRYYAIGAEVSRIEQEIRYQARTRRADSMLISRATRSGLGEAHRHVEEDGGAWPAGKRSSS
jgi:chromosome segregation protein